MKKSIILGMMLIITLIFTGCGGGGTTPGGSNNGDPNGSGPTPTNSPNPINDKAIVFTLDSSGDDYLYIINSDGSKLTSLGRKGTFPSISKDGKIVFYSWIDDITYCCYLCTINDDGSGIQVIPGVNYGDSDPFISADGTKLAFVSQRKRTGGDIWLIDLNTKAITQVTDSDDSTLRLPSSPSITADNQKIVFLADVNQRSDIFIINLADGTGPKNLTNTTDEDEENPSVSPDGSTIVFDSVIGNGNHQIFKMNADGSGSRVRLTTNDNRDYTHPDFSSDGSKIVFLGGKTLSSTPKGMSILTMNKDGSGLIELYTADWMDQLWNPQIK